MLRSLQSFWCHGKVTPEQSSQGPSSSSSYHNPSRVESFYQGNWSTKVTPSVQECMSTRTSKTSQSPLSPRQNSTVSSSPDIRSINGSTIAEDIHVQVPQNTSMKTVGNHQEIITTLRSTKIFKKTILIQQVPLSTDTTSAVVVKKRQESIPSSCHNLVTPTRIPLPLDKSRWIDAHLPVGHPSIIGRRRSSSTRKLSNLSTIPEHESVVVDELRMPEVSFSNPLGKSVCREITLS